MLADMVSRAIEGEIDRLYQRPAEEFTAARNALAKGAGADAARIRALAKPPIGAWAVNQLYREDPDTWNALIEASENARRVHRAVLSGKAADVRAANKVHDEAADRALKTTLAILAKAGHPATDATRHAIGTTLRALPADETPGRLTRMLQPAGFETLAGLSVMAGAGKLSKAPKAGKAESAPARAESVAAERPARSKADVKALTQARQSAAAATRALRDAENAVRREEFERVRTEREEKRAADAAEKARDAAAHAAAELEQAEDAAARAAEARTAAVTHAREAQQALTSARTQAETAAKDVLALEKAGRGR